MLGEETPTWLKILLGALLAAGCLIAFLIWNTFFR